LKPYFLLDIGSHPPPPPLALQFLKLVLSQFLLIDSVYLTLNELTETSIEEYGVLGQVAS
jgi:hypothetical protein